MQVGFIQKKFPQEKVRFGTSFNLGPKINQSLAATEKLLTDLNDPTRAIDHTHRIDHMSSTRQEKLKTALTKRFLAPEKLTKKNFEDFNKLWQVGPQYPRFLVGSDFNQNDKFHHFLLKSVGSGDIQTLWTRIKSALKANHQTVGILTPISLNPKKTSFQHDVEQRPAFRNFADSLLLLSTDNDKKEVLGLADEDVYILKDHGLDTWYKEVFMKKPDLSRAQLAARARSFYSDKLFNHEVNRLNRLRQIHDVPKGDDHLIIIKSNESSSGDPVATGNRIMTAAKQNIMAGASSDPTLRNKNIHQAILRSKSNTSAQESEAQRLLTQSAQWGSVNDGIVPITPKFFFATPEQQANQAVSAITNRNYSAADKAEQRWNQFSDAARQLKDIDLDKEAS
ncbi:MAG: hypothetical protein VKJ06_09330 [Vampirovibrionales bacterium]|nr:hypothetical protein [Vampirovibrionales bacterium]